MLLSQTHNIESWVAVIVMHLQNSSLVSQLPMEYDQKQLGISLQRGISISFFLE